MKTIRQLADELGVSKQAIHKHVSKLPSTMVSTGDNRSLHVNDAGEAIIRAKVAIKSTTKVVANPTTEDYQSLEILQLEHEIALLKKERDLERKSHKEKQALYEQELKAKDRQLEDSQKTIREIMSTMENAVTALNAAQALHAGTMHKQLTEPTPGEAAAVEVAQELPEQEPAAEPEPRRGFLSWFSKKK